MTDPVTADPASDRRWMEQALALGALGEGTTAPNPRVGCLLVRDGELVGRGYHRAPGEAHAEAGALSEAGDRARGATAYVNLEPCAHHGRTPPCADALIAAGVRRVVAGMQDPNPLVDGRGFARLREAGVLVEVGLLNAEAMRLNEAFAHWHRTGTPLVTLKAAATRDGQLSAAEGASRWITGPEARTLAHRLRMRHDAVLVGARTVARDDPSLTVRLPGVSVSRLPVILSRRLDLDPAAKLFQPNGGNRRPRIYTGPDGDEAALAPFRDRADTVHVAATAAGLDLRAVLEDLGRLGIQSVLVEGGGRTVAGFLDAGLAQRAALFVADRLVGARGATPMIDRASVGSPDQGWRIEATDRIPLGSDELVLGRIVSAEGRAPCSPD